jgi:hypothetical protein
MDHPKVNLTVSVDTGSSEGVNSRFESVNAVFNKINIAVARGSEDGTELLAEKIANMQRQFLAVGGHILTGELYNSISSEGGGLSYTIGSTLGEDEYSPSVIEYGRGPVYPIHCQFLHYFNMRTNEEVFSRYSKPYEGDPYVAPSAEFGEQIAQETLMDSIRGWL